MVEVLLPLAAGAAAGWLLRGRPRVRRGADVAMVALVVVLLFLLGLAAGEREAVRTGLGRLGLEAVGLGLAATAGSVALVAWTAPRLLPEGIGVRPPGGKAGPEPASDAPTAAGPPSAATGPPSAATASLRDVLMFPAAFLAGAAAGALVPAIPPLPAVWTTATLWALMAAVGVLVGADPGAFEVLRRAGVRVLAVPLLIMAGSLAGTGLLALVWPGMALREALAVGAGVGYYSLTSVLATELAGETLGVVALLANLFREALTLAVAPVLARLLGPAAPVASGGATAMDTTLPVITRASGRRWAVVAVFSGAVLTVLVPVVVTALLSV